MSSIITKGFGSNQTLITQGLTVSFEIPDYPEIKIPNISVQGGFPSKKKKWQDLEDLTKKHVKDLINTNSITVPSHLKFIDVRVLVQGNEETKVNAEVLTIQKEPIIVRVTM